MTNEKLNCYIRTLYESDKKTDSFALQIKIGFFDY
jgi:hypothetical protein